MKLTTPTLDAIKKNLPTLSDDGVRLNRNGRELDPGDVFLIEGSTGYYMLCAESRMHPRGCNTGLLHYFLVNLTTGRRVIQDGTLTLRPVKAELCIYGVEGESA